MLQKYEASLRSRNTSTGEGMSLYAHIRARIRVYAQGKSWKSWKAEQELASWHESWLNELKDYRLWINVLELDGRSWEQDFSTVRAMREAIAALDRNYVTVEEHYGEHDGMGQSWTTHYGKMFDR